MWNSQKFPKFLSLMLTFGVFSIGSPSQSQQVSQAPAVQSTDMPDRRYYSHIFTHINYLLEQGEPAVAQGQPSPSVARFYMERAGATEDENQKLITIARAWKREVDPIDSEAHSMIQAIRAQTPGGRLAPGQSLPAVPQALLDLQAQRDAVTLKYAASLHSQLGDNRFAALNSSLHRIIRTSFQARSLSGSRTAAIDK